MIRQNIIIVHRRSFCQSLYLAENLKSKHDIENEMTTKSDTSNFQIPLDTNEPEDGVSLRNSARVRSLINRIIETGGNQSKRNRTINNNTTSKLFQNPDKMKVLKKIFSKPQASTKWDKKHIKGKLQTKRNEVTKPSKEPFYKDTSSNKYSTSSNVIKHPLKQCIAPKNEDIAQLAHNLDRVLFSPGVHFLQDPRTRIYNFAPFLKKVINYKDFNFEAIGNYTPVSKHQQLLENSQKLEKQFYSSTSSMTSLLSKFYHFLNKYDKWDVKRFGKIPFSGMSNELPTNLILKPQGDFIDSITKEKKPVYSIQADNSCDLDTLLSAMGMCMETLLTNPQNEFVKYHKDSGIEFSEPPTNAYNYASYGDFLLRSQLDCYDERLPGNGTFDLKTRASTNIRYNSKSGSLEKNDYQIWKLNGSYESFEHEFRDMIRTGAMMKYLFQARIGQMDGIFIAYHSINTIFGFQYLPLEELDKLFYTGNTFSEVPEIDVKKLNVNRLPDKLPSLIGETQFKFSLEIWQKLLQEHILKDLNQSLNGNPTPFRLIVKYDTFAHLLRVFAIPVTDEEIEVLQSFPERFKRDFAEDENLAEVQKHARELRKFNDKSLETKEIFSYVIKMDSSLIDGKIRQYYKLPHDYFEDWQLIYNIKRTTNPPKKYISDLLKFPETKISERLNNVHEIYEKIGAIRKKSWEEKEKVSQVYHPKFKF
ncbi:mitochondrial translation system component, putative [Candida dubliniensis CD36]|uniref:Mitochondrial translation system component, putative n=1 Tax=Candida dubliniensis (strain CD36 / ATCC MYA-646 / CBS 7987 / NCPF 3949 / NRRL Y-17841) TaxID=573826 RepID=B9W9B0_CANDC|nr:mitochondrial translation system component, putative [Candida dubliniensis CD36]CAX45388.1 mitochondrial translation system component, putative [Candida dubliniensis CD36]